MSIIFVVAGIAVLILIHELGHFLAARFFNVKVEEFGFGFPPKLFSKKIGETNYSLNLLPLGGFVRLLGETASAPVPEEEKHRSFANQSAWKRSAIIVAGVLMNFLLGWLIISSLYFFGTEQPIAATLIVPNSPAEVAGLQVGDRFLGFESGERFVNFINENKGKVILLEINRYGENLIVQATPRADAKPDEGALGVGIAEAGFPKLPFLASIWNGLKTSLNIVVSIFTSLINLFVGLLTGQAPFESFVGPVGIFQVASQTGKLGFAYLWQLIGLISLNLMVLNIFPFPSLDGGRLAFIAVEKIKGSPVSQNRESLVHAAGFILLLLLMVAITIQDIIRLF